MCVVTRGSPCSVVQGCECLEGKDLALAVFVPLLSSMQFFPQDGVELSLRAGRGPELLVQPPGFTDRGPDERLQGHDLPAPGHGG